MGLGEDVLVEILMWRAMVYSRDAERSGSSQTRHLIHAINEATEAIPGWDTYVSTGRATQLWDGTLASARAA